MDMPSLKRVNQLGINYTVGAMLDFHYEKILENVLGIPEKEIVGIDLRGYARFLFEVNTKELYDSICENFTEREIAIDDGCVIQVDDISSYGTRIELSRVPFQVTNEMITNMLSRYGEVYKVQNFYKKFGKYTNLNKSGIRIAHLKLDTHIPSSLLIKETQTTINVSYANQPFSCFTCGTVGHKSWQCRKKKSEYNNVVEVIPSGVNLISEPNKEINKKSDLVGANLNFEPIKVNDDIDIHIDSSQSSNKYQCTRCDYKCSYFETFSTHLDLHTGDKPVKCSGCNFQISDSQDGIDQGIYHDEDEPLKCSKCRANNKTKRDTEIFVVELKCTECEHKCQTQDNLITHLKSHNIHLCTKCNYKANTAKLLKTHKQKHCKGLNSEIANIITVETTTANFEDLTSSAKGSKRELSKSPEEVKNSRKRTDR